MIKNKQDASVNPDIILTTDIRTLNGWDAELQKHIPNSYEISGSPALRQVLMIILLQKLCAR